MALEQSDVSALLDELSKWCEETRTVATAGRGKSA